MSTHTLAHKNPDLQGVAAPSLDLFSIRQTNSDKRCVNDAPYIVIPPQNGRPGFVYQASCHNWLCPRCGQMEAAKHYARIVSGAEKLVADGHSLYFVTLTCRGADMPLDIAQRDYYKWTNRLLTSMRVNIKRAGGHWSYSQVTERQKRRHPHSHLITASAPKDAFTIWDDPGRYYDVMERINAEIPQNMQFSYYHHEDHYETEMCSYWLMKASVRVGLGVQARISKIASPVGVATYVSKYLFKDAVFTEWPKNWRRVRYSRSWPKLPEYDIEGAFPILKPKDWERVRKLGGIVETDDELFYGRALARSVINVRCRVPNDIDGG